MDAVKRIRHFLQHWYTRYLVATELYMVEPWEKVIIHILLAIFFGVFWYFNYSIIVNGVAQLRDVACSAQGVEKL